MQLMYQTLSVAKGRENQQQGNPSSQSITVISHTKHQIINIGAHEKNPAPTQCLFFGDGDFAFVGRNCGAR